MRGVEVLVQRLAGRASRGLTLIEICAVLAIASVLAGVALPSFTQRTDRARLDGASANLVGDIRLARSEAVARRAAVRLTVAADADGGACLMVHTGAASDCTCGASGLARCSGTATLIKSESYPASARVSLRSNVPSMLFDPTHGTTTLAGTLQVASADGVAINHVVNILGRVRTCTPSAAHSSVKPC